MTIDSDMSIIVRELRRANVENFTGKMTISLDMNQGGIGKICVNMDKTLKNGLKRPVTKNI